MNLRHEGARGVDDPQATLLGLAAHRWGDAVGAEDDEMAVRHLVQLVHEDRPLLPQFIDDERVVHDLMADVHHSPEPLKGEVDDVDGADHSGAETAGRT